MNVAKIMEMVVGSYDKSWQDVAEAALNESEISSFLKNLGPVSFYFRLLYESLHVLGISCSDLNINHIYEYCHQFISLK